LLLTNVIPLLIPSCFWQNGLATKVEKSRKQMKERKNRAKKIRGVKKTKAGDAKKK
jgi:small subunit ribosomal protein S24e